MVNPWTSARCLHCGKAACMFGVCGCGLALKFHRKRCVGSRASPEQRQDSTTTKTPEMEIMKQMPRDVDLEQLNMDDRLLALFVSGQELRELARSNPGICAEILNIVIIIWRPGATAQSLLRACLAAWPGNVGFSVKIKAEVPRFKLVCEQTVTFDLLGDDLVKPAEFANIATNEEDLDQILLHRCPHKIKV